VSLVTVTLPVPENPFGDCVFRGQRRLSVAQIIPIVERMLELEPGSIVSARRDRAVAWPRQALMLVLYQQRPLSLPQIARLLGDRDHTTIVHGVRAARERWANDEEFRSMLDRIAAVVA
jgi:chromosomal replication initiator protein